MKMHLALVATLLAGALAGCTSTPETTPTAPPGSPPPGLPGSGTTPPIAPPTTAPPGGTPPATPPTTTPPAQSDVALNGAGATFPYPLLSKWGSEYNKVTGAQVNYQSIGSGGGIRAITDKTVDFAGSDAPLNAAQRTAASGLVHIPETLGAVTFVYNLPGITSLKMTGPVLADVFLGKVTRWNDAAIAALNPGLALPDRAIIVAHRSDGSGTTFVWTDYLSKVSPAWAGGPGKGTAVSWPVGLGGKGNEGVAGIVQGNPYAAGYVELAYATLQGLATAQVQNKAGHWITPSLASTSAAAAAAATTLPAGDASWEAVSITDAAAADAYPIASFTYFLVYKDLSGAYGSKMDATRARALLDFITWAIHDGQQFSEGLQYAKLPAPVVTLNEATLRSITHHGQPLLS